MATLYEVREEANAALSAGEHGRALSLALLMQRHFPDDYQTLELLGKLYLEARRLDEARGAFARVLEIDPENVVARAALAMVADEEGDPDSALEHFERAFDVDPGNHEIAAEIARLHRRLNHTRPPEPGSSMHGMARRFLIEGKFESAIPWLQEALRTGPDRTDVAMGLARAFWLAWRPQEAEEVAREVLAEHPDCLKALAIVAGVALSRGGEETLAILARMAELDPGNVVATALFADAGLAFPEREEKLDIPDGEIREALGSAEAAPEAEIVEEPHDTLPEETRLPAAEASHGGEDGEQEPPPEPAAAEPESAEMETANPLLRRLAAAIMETAPGEETASPSVEQASVVQVAAAKGEQTEVAVESAGAWEAAQESSKDHFDAARRYAFTGEVDLAVAEYRAALKVDPSAAQTVSEEVLALLEVDPENQLGHWLAGDALTLNGQFRKAVEQYLVVLKRAPEGESAEEGTGPQD